MKRAIELVLEVGMFVSALAAVAYALRAGVSIATFSGAWNSEGLIAAFAGPVAFALAKYLYARADAAPEVAK